MSRTWIKLYCHNTLEGSLRRDEYKDFKVEDLLKNLEARQNILRLFIRGVWFDILALAGDGKYGDIGEIKLSDKIGFTDDQIAGILSIPLDVWKWAKVELSTGDEARIEVDGKNIIKVINWTKYQSEYQRQKPYRQPRPADDISEEGKEMVRRIIVSDETNMPY